MVDVRIAIDHVTQVDGILFNTFNFKNSAGADLLVDGVEWIDVFEEEQSVDPASGRTNRIYRFTMAYIPNTGNNFIVTTEHDQVTVDDSPTATLLRQTVQRRASRVGLNAIPMFSEGERMQYNLFFWTFGTIAIDLPKDLYVQRITYPDGATTDFASLTGLTEFLVSKSVPYYFNRPEEKFDIFMIAS